MIFGIDVSTWQGNFNFTKAKNEGVSFVIIKAGGSDSKYGCYKDNKFERNYKEAKACGLNVGTYWYSAATNSSFAMTEAEWFRKNCLVGKQFELPIYMDVETATQKTIGRRAMTDVAKSWLNYLENQHYWVGIYSFLSFFNSYMYDSELTRYAHWVAQWSRQCTYKGNVPGTTTSCLGMWQFGGETNLLRSNKVAGVVCDQDYMLVDYPTLIKQSGCNGY